MSNDKIDKLDLKSILNYFVQDFVHRSNVVSKLCLVIIYSYNDENSSKIFNECNVDKN